MEPHTYDKEQLPKRNRFYQAKIDGRYLKSGEKDFTKLPSLYVITILNYDPFGLDYMMYTVRNRCEEVPDMPYDDGLQFVYFNTQGTKGGCEEIRKMLCFIQESKEKNVTDEATKELFDYVSRVKVQPEARLEYMRFDEILDMTEERTKQRDIFELLEDYGDIPEELKVRVEKEHSKEVLKKWLKLAAKSSSINEFIEKME